MINNKYKDNDIFVSTLLNPQANPFDLISNGINANNSLFLTKDEYKSSEFVKKLFTDLDGKFNEELFDKVYLVAALNYLNLTDDNLLNNLNQYIQYNDESIYKPTDSKDLNNKLSITRIRNPFEQITGIRTLGGTEESNKSIRELAQKSKIYDSEKGEYLNKSAEDLGLFGGLFSKPLVYAKWDFDGVHFDNILGRNVSHKKGEYRLNDDGKFFTETISKKLGYDQEFVALSDILTKEDSWLNKIDFFDSDDKEKSVIGTIFKTAAKITPYILPWTQGIWGGITAAVSLSSILPTFAKAIEGIATGEKNSEFTDNMNLLENYFKRFDNSISDEGRQKMFGLESFGATVSDIFGQLYQMRAMANLSNLTNLNWEKTQRLAKDNFIKTHKNELSRMLLSGSFPKTEAGIKEFWQEIAASTPELSNLIKKQSSLSRGLSFGYMALLTSGDVYKEALEGGFDRRTAGLAALAATLGLYGMMSVLDDRISAYFLDSVVGYRGGENRYLINNALRPLILQSEEVINKIPGLSQLEKQKALGNIVGKTRNSLKNVYYSILDGTSEFWTRSVGEAIEEVSEEVAMDMTKGMFDALSALGFTGNTKPGASFNTLENTFSSEGAFRYLQNALGGFIGGSLFHLQQNYITPALLGKPIDRGTSIDIIKLILQGKAEEAKQVMRDIGNRDNLVAEIPEAFNNIKLPTSSNGTTRTRGQLIADSVINQIEFLEGIMGEHGANLSLDQIVSKVIRDNQIKKLIEESNIDKLIIDDFDNVVASLAEKSANLQEGLEATPEIKNLEEDLNKFLTGENSEFYLKAALAYLNSNIRNNLTSIDLYTYAKAETGKDWNALTDEEKESVGKKHKQYINSTDKKEYINNMVKAMDELESRFSPAFVDYAKAYSDIRALTINGLLSLYNWSFGENVQNEDYYSLLTDISLAAQNSGLKGATIEDIFLTNPESIKNTIGAAIYNDNKELIDSLAAANNITPEELIEEISILLANKMSSFPIDLWNTARLQKLLDSVFKSILELLVNRNETNSLKISGFFYGELSKDIIKAYINLQNILDGELVKRLKKGVSESLNNKNIYSQFDNALYNIVYEDEFGDETPQLTLSEGQRSHIKDILIGSLNNNKSLEDVAHEVTDYLSESYKQDSNEEIRNIFVNHKQADSDLYNAVVNFLLTSELLLDFRFVKENSNKKVIQNPLYELLRKISFQLSPDVNTTIFNLLEDQNTSLLTALDITEFVKMQDLEDQISTAKSIIQISRAILAGMEDTELGDGKLFGYNTQVKSFLKRFRNEENSDHYQTLSTKDIFMINDDLNLIESKLNFIEELSKLNTNSKKEEDNRTRIVFYNYLLDKLKEDLSKFTIKNVSILTPDDLEELESYDENKRYIGICKLEHKINERFQQILKTTGIEEAIKELFDNLNIDIKSMTLSSLESYGLSKNIKLISDYDYLAWITTILSVDQNLYQQSYREYLNRDDVEKVPLFIQEYNTKLGFAFFNDVSGVHDAVAKYIKSNSPEYPAATTKFFYVDGVSGSGKTTAIGKTILDLSKQSDILIAAPNNDQKIKLQETLGILLPNERVLSIQLLLEKFIDKKVVVSVQQEAMSEDKSKWTVLQHNEIGYDSLKNTINSSVVNKNVTDVPKVIVIDESTHINTAQLQLLELAANEYGFKILLLGDMYQEAATIANQEAHVDLIFTWKGPRLNISIRPANVNKKDNIDSFTAALNTYYGKLRETHKGDQALNELLKYLDSGLTLKYYEDNESLDGDKVVSEISVEDLNKLKRISNRSKIGIITKLDDNGEILDQEFKAVLDSSELIPQDYILKSPDKIHPNAVQGSEFDYIIINNSGLEPNLQLLDQIKKLYTLVTRSQNGGLIKIDSTDIINGLHLNSSVTAKPGLFRLPGINQLSEIKNQRIDDIILILGDEKINEPVISNNIKIQQKQEEIQSQLPSDFESDKEIPIYGRTQETNSNLLFCYGFYSHTGLRLDSGKFVDGNRQINLDLSGLKPTEGFSKEAVNGFMKLKNLITLYALDESNFKLGLNSLNEFTKDIAVFIKELNPNLQNVDNLSALKWLQKSIKIDTTPYVIGIKMDRDFDSPLPGFGLYDIALVDLGMPLLLMGRKVTISDENFSVARYISTGVLAKSKTVENSTKASNDIKESIRNLESRALTDLKEKDIVIYNSTSEFVRFGNADGRLYRGKNEHNTFDTIAKLISGGVNVKEVGIITNSQNQDGTYKFNEWAKQFCPDIDKLTIKDGKFTHSGKYFARVSYTSLSDNKTPSVTDHVLLLDLALIKTADALAELKTAKDFQEKKLILHVAGYSKLSLEILKRLGVFLINSNNSILLILNDFLATLFKNQEKYSKTIDLINDLLNKLNITYDLFLNIILSNPTLSILMTDFIVKNISLTTDNNVLIGTRYGQVSIPNDFGLYTNVSISENGLPDYRGICQLTDFAPSKLGLRNIHYEPAMFGLSTEAIEGLTEVKETNNLPVTPEQKQKVPKIVSTEDNAIRDQIIQNIFFGEEPESEQEQETLKLLENISGEIDINYLSLSEDGHIVIDEAYVETLGEDFKQKLNEILHKYQHCG